MNIFELSGKIAVDNAQANNALKETAKVGQDTEKALAFDKSVNDAFTSVGKSSVTLAKWVTGIGTAAVGAVGLIAAKGGWDRAMAIEQAQAKLKGLGHDTETISKVMDNALNAVRGTAYNLGDAASLAAQMIASGIEPGEELESVLSTIADTAAITGRGIDEIGMIYAKVAATGKLDGQILMQAMKSGLPVLDMLANNADVARLAMEKYGTDSKEAIRDLISDGLIDFDMFTASMEQAMGGAAQSMGDTTKGAIMNTQAALSRLGVVIMKPIMNFAKSVLGDAIPAIDALAERLRPTIDSLVAFMGTADKIKPILYGIATAIMVAIVPGLLSMAGSIIAATAPLAPLLLAGMALGKLFYEIKESSGLAKVGLTMVAGAVAILTAKFVTHTVATMALNKETGIFKAIQALKATALTVSTTALGKETTATLAGVTATKASTAVTKTSTGAIVMSASALKAESTARLANTTATNANTTAQKTGTTVKKLFNLETQKGLLVEQKDIAVKKLSAVATVISTTAKKAGAVAQALFTTATTKGTTATITSTIATKAKAVAMGGLSVGLKLATAAMWLFNVALLANPITAIIVALAALGAGIAYFVNKANQATKAANDMRDSTYESTKELRDNWNELRKNGEAQSELAKTILDGVLAIQKQGEEVANTIEKHKLGKKAIAELKEKQEQYTEAVKNRIEVVKELENIDKSMADTKLSVMDAEDKVREKTEALTEAIANYGEGSREAERATLELESANNALSDASNKLEADQATLANGAEMLSEATRAEAEAQSELQISMAATSGDCTELNKILQTLADDGSEASIRLRNQIIEDAKAQGLQWNESTGKMEKDTRNTWQKINDWDRRATQATKDYISGLASSAGETWGNMRTSASEKWSQMKTDAGKKFGEIADKIKEKLMIPVNWFKNLSFSWPKIPLPRFSITPSGWKVTDLIKGDIPKLGVEFYSKGGIMTDPTAFGIDGNRLMVGGEKSAEGIIPLTRDVLGQIGAGIVQASDMGSDAIASGIEVLIDEIRLLRAENANLKVFLDSGLLVGGITSGVDKELQGKAALRVRGVTA